MFQRYAVLKGLIGRVALQKKKKRKEITTENLTQTTRTANQTYRNFV